MGSKLKMKVLQIPGWMKQDQRDEKQSHSPSSRAKHDLFEADVSSDEEHGGPDEKGKPDGTIPRARAGLDVGKMTARRAKKTPRQKPKSTSGDIPGAADLDKATRWTSSPAEPFLVKGEEREKQVKMLSKKTKEQKALKSKLGEAFMDAYRRYRVRITPSYAPVHSEQKLAEDAAVITFLRDLTPGRVIAYWHEHIGDFTQLKAVPLRFLASPTNIDQVALVAGDGARGTSESRPKGRGGAVRVHAYGDARALDARLRPSLEDAGFNVDQFSDRELMSIQNAARAKASGRKMFVSSKLAPMVKCAAEELYG